MLTNDSFIWLQNTVKNCKILLEFKTETELQASSHLKCDRRMISWLWRSPLLHSSVCLALHICPSSSVRSIWTKDCVHAGWSALWHLLPGCFYMRTESQCHTPLLERLYFGALPHSSHQPVCTHTCTNTHRQTISLQVCANMHEIPEQNQNLVIPQSRCFDRFQKNGFPAN